jgi:hypothetical protein
MKHAISVVFPLACALTSCSTSREAAVHPKSVSEVASDTTRPPVPSSYSEFDTTVVVPNPSDSDVIYYRNIFFLQFDDSTSGTTVRSVLQRYQATIVGGSTSPWDRGAYVVRVPDPGATWEDVQRVAAQMQSERGVYLARPRAYRSKLIFRATPR